MEPYRGDQKTARFFWQDFFARQIRASEEEQWFQTN